VEKRKGEKKKGGKKKEGKKRERLHTRLSAHARESTREGGGATRNAEFARNGEALRKRPRPAIDDSDYLPEIYGP